MTAILDKTQVLRLEVEQDTTGLTNLVQNPSGDLGGWGWVTPVAGSRMAGNPGGPLTYYAAASVANDFYTEALPITLNNYVAASWLVNGATAGYFYKVKIEYLDNNFNVLGSSTQTGYLDANATSTRVNYGPFQVTTAGTTAVRLRFDMYSNNTGSNPASGSNMSMSTVTVAQSSTSAALGTFYTNLCSNPSFETNTTGWAAIDTRTTIARVTSPAGAVGSACLAMTMNTAPGNAPGVQVNMPTLITGIVAGKNYTVTAKFRSAAVSRIPNITINWFDSSNNLISSSSPSGVAGTSTTAWNEVAFLAASPTNATKAQIYISVTTLNQASNMPNGEVHYVDAVMLAQSATQIAYFDGASVLSGTTYAWTGTANNSTSTSSSTNLAFIPPAIFGNIISSSFDINTVREELNLGTLTASIRNPLIDPANSTLLRPGRRCRLMAYDANISDWSPLFNGKILVANAAYDESYGISKIANVTLTAVDNNGPLASQKRASGVAAITDLPFVLEGCGVPWNCNGSGNQVASATVVATNDNASALDQVAITRDSQLGYAWVDRYGTLQAWTNDSTFLAQSKKGSGTGGPSFVASDVFDIDATFSTDALINEVNVTLLVYNTTTAQTDSFSYGPYRDETSIAEWGVKDASFTVQGIAPSAIPTFAASVLTANSQPIVRVNAITINITDTTQLSSASGKFGFTDLYDYGTVDLTAAATALGLFHMRVTRVEHAITLDTWEMTVGFANVGAVASPQLVPTPGNHGGQSGRVAQTTIASANSIGLNTETLRLSVGPITAYNGQRYKITGKCQPRSDTAAAFTNMKLKWDTVGTGTTGTVVDSSDKDHRVANRSETLMSAGEFVYSGSDGDQIYVKMTMTCSGGTGTDDPAAFPVTWLTVDAVS